MARAPAASLWMVTRVAVHSSAWNAEPVFYTDDTESPVGVPREGFSDKKTAEAARKRLEHRARETAPLGPFLRSLLLGDDLADVLNRFTSAAKAANLPLPDLTELESIVKPTAEIQGHLVSSYNSRQLAERAIDAWWTTVAADITPTANSLLWDMLFPDFQFYTLNRVLFEQ